MQRLQTDKEEYLTKSLYSMGMKNFNCLLPQNFWDNCLYSGLASFGLKIMKLQEKMYSSIVIYTKRSDLHIWG